MANFVGLDGVKGGKLTGEIVRSVSAAMTALKKNRCVSGAGDYGAWIVWRDDAGKYRCDFSRHCITRADAVVSTKAKAKTGIRFS